MQQFRFGLMGSLMVLAFLIAEMLGGQLGVILGIAVSMAVNGWFSLKTNRLQTDAERILNNSESGIKMLIRFASAMFLFLLTALALFMVLKGSPYAAGIAATTFFILLFGTTKWLH